MPAGYSGLLDVPRLIKMRGRIVSTTNDSVTHKPSNSAHLGSKKNDITFETKSASKP